MKLEDFPVSEFVQGLTREEVLHEVPAINDWRRPDSTPCSICHFCNSDKQGSGESCRQLGLYLYCETEKRSIVFVSTIDLITNKLTP